MLKDCTSKTFKLFFFFNMNFAVLFSTAVPHVGTTNGPFQMYSHISAIPHDIDFIMRSR